MECLIFKNLTLIDFKTMEQTNVIKRTEAFVRGLFREESSGHDWWHIHRVRNMAKKIAEIEGGDLFIIEMAALLHDLDDWKLNGDNDNKSVKWLETSGIDEKDCSRIIRIIEEVSFKGAGVETIPGSIESAIVQDADRLDAIGAIGIARTFAYGGNKNRLIYHPDIKPIMHLSFEEYKSSKAPTINHFYEKLLLLKERMNTNTSKNIAEKRHNFMLDFLNEFYDEWESKI